MTQTSHTCLLPVDKCLFTFITNFFLLLYMLHLIKHCLVELLFSMSIALQCSVVLTRPTIIVTHISYTPKQISYSHDFVGQLILNNECTDYNYKQNEYQTLNASDLDTLFRAHCLVCPLKRAFACMFFVKVQLDLSLIRHILPAPDLLSHFSDPMSDVLSLPFSQI